MNDPNPQLPVSALERIDDACMAFEDAWKSGRRPSIEAFLAKVELADERTALLTELLALEVDYLQSHGEHVAQDSYYQRFPEQRSAVDSAFQRASKTAPGSHFRPPTCEELEGYFPGLEVMELIGAGGMGAVYKAKQRGLDRTVAIKILPQEIGSNVQFALRFTREARALAKLNHPNIVTVFEFGNEKDIYYFLMEFVEGTTLREVIQHGELSAKEALAIVPQLCDALQYAHDAGVVHRDIKPENILVDRDGSIKIADFGLSRLMGDETQGPGLTASHHVMGTLRYMAPEQMEGAHDVDHRADIYSLGVVFYEMLTGELPFGRFDAPSEKVAVDVRIDDVVLRTLEKEPVRRYQHASQVKTDVQSITKSPTLDTDATAPAASPADSDLEHQALAARVLLMRRDLMQRVGRALTPLFWWQLAQMLCGVTIVGFGIWCWTRNMHDSARMASGIILHVYGVLTIIAGGLTCGKIRGVDYTQSIEEVREQLEGVQRMYLRSGLTIGLSWWLIWIPLIIAPGGTFMLYPNAFWTSIGVGVAGIAACVFLVLRMNRSQSRWAQQTRKTLSGESLANAFSALDEIAKSNIS